MNTSLDQRAQLVCARFGLIDELGELVGPLKKHHFQGHDLDEAKLIEEAGDICWYGMTVLTALKIDANGLHERNPAANDDMPIEKLIFVAHHTIDRVIDIIDAHAGMPMTSELILHNINNLLVTIASIVRHYVTTCTLTEIMERNVTKLERRYGAAFSTAASQQRAETLA